MATETITIQCGSITGNTSATAAKADGDATGILSAAVSIVESTDFPGLYVATLSYDDTDDANRPLGQWGVNIGGFVTLVTITADEDEYMLDSGTGNVPSLDSSEIATAVAARITGLKLTVAQQRSLTGGQELYVYQGDDYRDDPTRIEIDQSGLSNPSADLSAYHLVVSFQQSESVVGIRMEIEGEPGEHYALFDPPASLTETFESGRFEALFRVEYAANEYKTVSPGFVIVETHDVEPGDIVDI